MWGVHNASLSLVPLMPLSCPLSWGAETRGSPLEEAGDRPRAPCRARGRSHPYWLCPGLAHSSCQDLDCGARLTSIVGSYSSTKWFWISWMVSALLPTPPAPTTTSLYSVIAPQGPAARGPTGSPAPPAKDGPAQPGPGPTGQLLAEPSEEQTHSGPWVPTPGSKDCSVPTCAAANQRGGGLSPRPHLLLRTQ